MQVKQAINILNNVDEEIKENEQYLSELDAAIGDGDHGHNMVKGMNAVTKVINDKDYTDFGSLFKDVAMQLISNVGGASGPLYGTAFMEISKICKDKTSLEIDDLVIILNAAISGIQKRGKAVENEKTMLDVLIPTTNYIKENGINGVLEYINECVEKTKDIQATKGRASYLQERSIGHIDPGAKSMSIFLTNVIKGI